MHSLVEEKRAAKYPGSLYCPNGLDVLVGSYGRYFELGRALQELYKS